WTCVFTNAVLITQVRGVKSEVAQLRGVRLQPRHSRKTLRQISWSHQRRDGLPFEVTARERYHKASGSDAKIVSPPSTQKVKLVLLTSSHFPEAEPSLRDGVSCVRLDHFRMIKKICYSTF